MNYIQMTLDDWVEMKCKLKQELLGVRQSFVRIGYMLRKIEEQKGYEQDGYKSIAEFAQKELGLHPSTTTRFMKINQEYSIDGYSERLREEYLDLSRSQLEEMLKLPEEDRKMIQTETQRGDIRNLKRFNQAGPAAGAENMEKLIETFFYDNPKILNRIFEEEISVKQFQELVNPSGNRSYKKGLYFLMMYETKIAVKKFGETPMNMTWEEFQEKTWKLFELAAGPNTWENYFGETLNEPPKQPIEQSKKSAKEQTEISKQKEEIAPAQKEPETQEILSAKGIEEVEKNEESEEKNETEEQLPGQMNIEDYPELMPAGQEEPKMETSKEPKEEFGNRKIYMDTLTEYGLAEYLVKHYKEGNLERRLQNVENMEAWLEEEVDHRGYSLEE